MEWTSSPQLVRHLIYLICMHLCFIKRTLKRGSQDRPKVDVIIADSGELEIEYEVDADGNQVPLHAEL